MFELLDSFSGDVMNLILNGAAAAAEAAADAGVQAAEAVADAGVQAAEAAAEAGTAVADAGTAAAEAAAQAAETASSDAAKASSSPEWFVSIQNFFAAGGTFMYVNVCSLILLLTILVERAIRLFFSFSLNPQDLLKNVVQCLNDGRVDRAIKICRGENQAKPLKAPIACVFRAALEKADSDEIEISKTVEDALMENTPRITNRVNFLWPLSNASVLIGLVGTILGLIRSFASMGAVDASKRSEVLSAGISEAMNNTAFGLGIAITGTLGHLWISNKAKKMVDSLELYSSRIENVLVKRLAYNARHGITPNKETASKPLSNDKMLNK